MEWIAFMLFTLPVFAQRVGPIKVNAGNARAYRDTAKLKIFGTTEFPYNWLPDNVQLNVTTLENYDGFPYTSILYPAGNLQSADQIDVYASNNIEDFPVPVHAFVFHPQNSNGKLFIYHSGHCAATASIEDVWTNNNHEEPGLVIPRLIAEGYTVLSVPMLNYRLAPPNEYYCGYNNHNALFQQGHYANPLALFFRPLIASLNYLGRSNYSAIYMCGLSGGGWTTSVYPAIDSSIVYSFPIAGAWPKAVRSRFYPNGDGEQAYPRLYNALDAHELMVLSCLAPPRTMLQINNRYDNCCFGGNEGHLYYVDSVKKALQGTGAVFDFYLDETVNNHQVAPNALETMLAFISQGKTTLQVLPSDSAEALQPYTYNIPGGFAISDDLSELQFSLIKGPSWINLDPITGVLSGIPPVLPLTGRTDTISFKVEDTDHHFVIYNYQLKEKRSVPVLFTVGEDLKTVYLVPGYSKSISQIPGNANQFFQFTSGAVVDSVSVSNNSVIVLYLNQPVASLEAVSYTGGSSNDGIRYVNGLRLDNFNFVRVKQNLVETNLAIKGMIRFNSDTRKFEYFNGTHWVNMN